MTALIDHTETVSLLDRDGAVVVPGLIESERAECLCSLADRLLATSENPSRGVRGALGRCPDFSEVLALDRVRALLGAVLGKGWFPVRSILFDKSPDANWLVPWHQDTTIAVRERRDVSGFGPWSVKNEIPHVQPLAEVLAAMVTVRFHLDECDETNGALWIAPGSHRAGIIPSDRIEPESRKSSAVCCDVARGGALLMRPLVLHRSGKSIGSRRRRVLHIECASRPLPDGLEWCAPYQV